MAYTDTLNNGLLVLSDKLEFFQSFSLGFFINVGSVDETQDTQGYSHLLEHMLFKGTRKRSYRDISHEIDAAGGEINAFTEKEYTCLHLQLRQKYLSLGLNILTDMIKHSLLDPQELHKEKQVIIQEIQMHEDTPDESIYDLFFRHFFGKHPLGFSILGKRSSIHKATHETLSQFHKDFYTAENMRVSIAGNFDYEVLLKELEGHSFGRGEKVARGIRPPIHNNTHMHKVRDCEQVYFIWGFPLAGRQYIHKVQITLMNYIFGGGASSRLFREVREKRGLAYVIESFYCLYGDAGVFGVYSSSSVREYPLILEIIREELYKFTTDGISEEELDRAREQLKGSLTFESELLESRMHAHYQSYTNHAHVFDYAGISQQIDACSPETVNTHIRQNIHMEQSSIYSLGPSTHTEHRILEG